MSTHNNADVPFCWIVAISLKLLSPIILLGNMNLAQHLHQDKT